MGMKQMVRYTCVTFTYQNLSSYLGKTLAHKKCEEWNTTELVNEAKLCLKKILHYGFSEKVKLQQLNM